MPLSERKNRVLLPLLLLLAASVAVAATPPDAEVAAANAALSAAARAQPRGPAADMLAEAQARFAQAQEAMVRKKYKDAIRLADEARAGADRALAAARLANARDEVEDKTTRNVDLRRQLLVKPEATP
jgi:hypothetical protein